MEELDGAPAVEEEVEAEEEDEEEEEECERLRTETLRAVARSSERVAVRDTDAMVVDRCADQELVEMVSVAQGQTRLVVRNQAGRCKKSGSYLNPSRSQPW